MDSDKKIKYFELIHAALAHKRKTLMHNLKDYYLKNREIADINSRAKEKNLNIDFDKIFESVNLDKKVRGEDVDMKSYIKLLSYMQN